MVDVSYQPTFHHIDWVDRVDRVEASGPNGFNGRFNAIQRDLGQLSTVVGQIDAAIKEFQAPPPTTAQQLAFTPTLHPVSANASWDVATDGRPTAAAGFNGTTTVGLMNLTLPAGLRLTQLRLVSFFLPDDTQQAAATVTLSRAPLRLTLSAPVVDQLAIASVTGSGTPSDVRALPNGQFATIDPANFRYFLTARYTSPPDPFAEMTIDTVQLSFVPA